MEDVYAVVLTAEPPALPRFADVYGAHFDYVWRLLSRLGVRSAELEDAAQEVFIVVHRRLSDFDPSRPIRPWIAGIAHRVAMAERRRARHHREQLCEAPAERLRTVGDDPEAALMTRQRTRRVQAALSRLDMPRRAVFVMFEMEGMACTEIAEALDIPVNTAVEPCDRCKALTQDAVSACLADEIDIDPCVEIADSCAGLCRQTDTCEACRLSASIVVAACGQAGRADCDAIAAAAETTCDAACAPPLTCDECVVGAAMVAAECHAFGGQGCGDAAAEVLAECGECAFDGVCLPCFDAPIECITPDCLLDLAARMGDCVGACLAECGGCDTAALTTALICEEVDAQCGAVAELTGAVCSAACAGDQCGICAADVQRARALCGEDPGCERLVADELCFAECAPAGDDCGECGALSAQALAGCEAEGEPACEALALFLESACAQVCAQPDTACSSCKLDVVREVNTCVADRVAVECLELASDGDLCPICEGCDACVAAADLERAICATLGMPEECVATHAQAIERCQCEQLPDCGARIGEAARLCAEAGFEGICEELIAIVTADCTDE